MTTPNESDYAARQRLRQELFEMFYIMEYYDGPMDMQTIGEVMNETGRPSLWYNIAISSAAREISKKNHNGRD